MDEIAYQAAKQEIFRRLEELPDHSPEAVKQTADQLAGLNATLAVGRMELEPRDTGRQEIRRRLEAVDRLPLAELEATRNIEPPYSGGDRDSWARETRLARMTLLIKQYTLLSRLRDDDPEAWDEINELFFDD